MGRYTRLKPIANASGTAMLVTQMPTRRSRVSTTITASVRSRA